MIGPGEVFVALFVVGIPTLTIGFLISRWFRLREKKLEIDAMMAAEKAAQYVSHSKEVEQRLAVLERIVTDGGMETAAQIEALRAPRLASKAPEGQR